MRRFLGKATERRGEPTPANIGFQLLHACEFIELPLSLFTAHGSVNHCLILLICVVLLSEPFGSLG